MLNGWKILFFLSKVWSSACAITCFCVHSSLWCFKMGCSLCLPHCPLQTGWWMVIPVPRRRSKRRKDRSFLKKPQSEKTTGTLKYYGPFPQWKWKINKWVEKGPGSVWSILKWSIWYKSRTPLYNGSFRQKTFCCSKKLLPFLWPIIVFHTANAPWAPCGPSLFIWF